MTSTKLHIVKKRYPVKPCSKCGYRFKVGEEYVQRFGFERKVSNRCKECFCDAKGRPIFK